MNFKPKIMEKQLSTKKEFMQLSPGFKKIFDKGGEVQDIRIPISGYAGHRKGKISENLHGKTEREISIQSKKIERIGMELGNTKKGLVI